jgi:adenosylhomocysteine nucleosidase
MHKITKICALFFALLLLLINVSITQANQTKPLFGIVCAVQTEAEPILKNVSNLKTASINGIKYFQGTIDNKNIVLVVGGYGSINATIATTLLIERFNPNYILFSGSSGLVNKTLNIGDVVISKSLYALDYGDPNNPLPNFKPFAPNPVRNIDDPLYFYGDIKLLSLLSTIKEPSFLQLAHDAAGTKIKAKISIDKLACSDHFPNNDADLIRMQKNNVAAVSMEGVGVLKTCWIFQKPCAVIWGISNAVGAESNNPYLAWNKTNETLADYNAGQVVAEIIRKY